MSATPIDMPTWESMRLMGAATVGRLCIIDGGYPLAFPLNYRLLSDPTRLVFRTNSTSALARYRGPASFELDEIDAAHRSAWSVIARGTLRTHSTDDELADTRPMVSQGRFSWVVLDVGSISGRRFHAQRSGDEFTVEWQPATSS